MLPHGQWYEQQPWRINTERPADSAPSMMLGSVVNVRVRASANQGAGKNIGVGTTPWLWPGGAGRAMADNRAALMRRRNVGRESESRAPGARRARCPCCASGTVRPLMEGLGQQRGGGDGGSGTGKSIGILQRGDWRASGQSPVTPAGGGEAKKAHP